MGSTRLPGKVLKAIANRPMLSYQLERLRRVKRAQRIVIATTNSVSDEAIVEFCVDEGIDCIRGSENDVLARYCEAVRVVGATTIVRVTSDCPLIDPELIDRAIEAFQGPGHPDFVSNMLEPTWPYGMAVEVVSAAALSEANAESQDASEREHVMPFIYWRPKRYRLVSLTMAQNLTHHRWTVDTQADFELASRILEVLYVRNPQFTMADVLSLLEAQPELSRINAHVAQKAIAPGGV